MKTETFLQQMKAKCESKAKQMASIELSVIDNASHRQELKQYFGFTDKTIAKRKSDLQKAVS